MKSRTWTKDSIPFENFKIGSLHAVIPISKVRLKPENLTSKNGLNHGELSNINFIYTFQNPHEKLNRAFL
jgi:hypothetical protein